MAFLLSLGKPEQMTEKKTLGQKNQQALKENSIPIRWNWRPLSWAIEVEL